MSDRAVEIQALAPIARYSLRMRTSDAPFDMPINTCTATNDRIVARLGPDEWLLLGDASDATTEGRAFRSLVDIGHRHLAFEVSGTRASDVLNAGCPLDLHDATFPPGSATRTVLGKAEIVLMRPSAERSYRVECWRSFAPYVSAFLREAAREFASA